MPNKRETQLSFLLLSLLISHTYLYGIFLIKSGLSSYAPHDTNVHKFLSTSNLYLRLVNVNLINLIYLLH